MTATLEAALAADEAARLVEFSEAGAYARLATGATGDIRARYGVDTQHIGSACALASPGIGGSLMLNRVIGLGIAEPVTDDVLDAVEAVYAERGVATYAVELAPVAQPAGLASRLRSRRYMPFKSTSMLYREARPVEPPPSPLDVRRVGREHASAFAELVCRVFQLDEPFPALLCASMEEPDWQHFMAFDRDEPVAAAMTRVHGDVAWIGWVCTRAEHRGRGAQSALAAAQLEAAQRAGARWVTLEAATGTRNQPSASLRNYTRLGWTVAYDRPVYVRKQVRG